MRAFQIYYRIEDRRRVPGILPLTCVRNLWRAALWFCLLAAGTTVADIELNVGNVNGTRGGTIAVPIQMVGTTNIVGVQFDFIYPPAQILPGAPFTGAGTNGPTVISAEMTNGVRRVVIYSSTNSILPNGILVYVPISVETNTTDGVSALYVSNVILARADGTEEPVLFSGDGTLTVAPASPARLGSIVWSKGGTVEFRVTGTDGAAYTIQASTNLTDWMSVNTFLTSGGGIDFVDTAGTNYNRRFFRALGH